MRTPGAIRPKQKDQDQMAFVLTQAAPVISLWNCLENLYIYTVYVYTQTHIYFFSLQPIVLGCTCCFYFLFGCFFLVPPASLNHHPAHLPLSHTARSLVPLSPVPERLNVPSINAGRRWRTRGGCPGSLPSGENTHTGPSERFMIFFLKTEAKAEQFFGSD